MARVRPGLNAVDDSHNDSTFETDEREEPCDYIDESLTKDGVGVVALTARHDLGRYQLTDKCREW